jgi:acetate kinase
LLERAPERLRIVSCHLGNGASVCAIDRGRSVDTSMGMTALEGLVMGTRSGDLDPGVPGFVARTLGLDPAQIEAALYHDSGLKALSGVGLECR